MPARLPQLALAFLLGLLLLLPGQSHAQQSPACSPDELDGIITLLQDTRSSLEADDQELVVSQLADAERRLGALLEACLGAQLPPLVESLRMPELFEGLVLEVSYPRGWQAVLDGVQVRFVSMPDLLEQDPLPETGVFGALSGFSDESLVALGLLQNSTTSAIAEVLVERFASAFDDTALGGFQTVEAEDLPEALTDAVWRGGEVEEDGIVLRIVFTVATIGTEGQHLLFFFATPDPDFPLETLSLQILNSLQVLPAQ